MRYVRLYSLTLRVDEMGGHSGPQTDFGILRIIIILVLHPGKSDVNAAMLYVFNFLSFFR